MAEGDPGLPAGRAEILHAVAGFPQGPRRGPRRGPSRGGGVFVPALPAGPESLAAPHGLFSRRAAARRRGCRRWAFAAAQHSAAAGPRRGRPSRSDSGATRRSGPACTLACRRITAEGPKGWGRRTRTRRQAQQRLGCRRSGPAATRMPAIPVVLRGCCGEDGDEPRSRGAGRRKMSGAQPGRGKETLGAQPWVL
jgi:hypothetical protein